MIDYFRETKYVLERVCFKYLGAVYEGQGVLRWNPSTGFQLEAFLERNGPPLKGKFDVGKIGLRSRGDFCRINMKPSGYDWVMAPHVYLGNNLGLFWEKYLSIELGRVIFCSSRNTDRERSNWSGSAVYEMAGRVLLPDRVNERTELDGTVVQQRCSSPGLSYKVEDDLSVTGRLIDDTHLELHWFLNKQH